MSKTFVHISSLEGRDEAATLTELLSDHDIDAEVSRKLDPDVPGRSQLRHVWGSLRVAPEDAAHATRIVQRWREAEPDADRRRKEREQDLRREAARRHGREGEEERDTLSERDIRAGRKHRSDDEA